MSPPRMAVEAFVGAIGGHLPGPSKPRAEILAELRDGLIETVDSHIAAGVGEAEAVERALREFGDAPTLARSFLPELAAQRARRTVTFAFLSAPIVIALWLAAARSRGVARTGGLFDSPAAHATAAALVAAVLLAGIGTIAVTGRATRWLGLSARAPLLGAAATTSIVAATDLALLSMLSWRLADYPGTIHALALGAATLASTARLIASIRASCSSLWDAQ